MVSLFKPLRKIRLGFAEILKQLIIHGCNSKYGIAAPSTPLEQQVRLMVQSCAGGLPWTATSANPTFYQGSGLNRPVQKLGFWTMQGTEQP